MILTKWLSLRIYTKKKSCGQIERLNQTHDQRLTKMLWDEVSQTQGYRWIGGMLSNDRPSAYEDEDQGNPE